MATAQKIDPKSLGPPLTLTGSTLVIFVDPKLCPFEQRQP